MKHAVSNILLSSVSTQCGCSLTWLKTTLNIPKRCVDAFCEHSHVWQLFPALSYSFTVKNNLWRTVLFIPACLVWVFLFCFFSFLFFSEKNDNAFRVCLCIAGPNCKPSTYTSRTQTNTGARWQSRANGTSTLAWTHTKTWRLWRWRFP